MKLSNDKLILVIGGTGAQGQAVVAQSWRRVWEQVIPLFRLSAGDSKNHLYHQRHRELAHATA